MPHTNPPDRRTILPTSTSLSYLLQAFVLAAVLVGHGWRTRAGNGTPEIPASLIVCDVQCPGWMRWRSGPHPEVRPGSSDGSGSWRYTAPGRWFGERATRSWRRASRATSPKPINQSPRASCSRSELSSAGATSEHPFVAPCSCFRDDQRPTIKRIPSS